MRETFHHRLGLDGLGPRLLALRLRLGLSSSAMAMLLDMKPRAYSEAERGRKAMPARCRPRLVELEAKP